MIVDPYTRDVVGPAYRKLIENAKKTIIDKRDDFIMVIVGLTGTGKSRLGLHTQRLVTTEPFIEQIALTPADMAHSVKHATDTPRGERYVQYDEGKLSRRDWNTQWSKDLLELYHDCRGLNIFHVWCTAYPDLLDRVFIKERVGGLVFIYTKDVNRPRHFLYFTKRDLLKFLEQNKKISTDLLRKHGKAHASLQSWFRDYEGPMLVAYEEKKEDRMNEVVDKFFEKWSDTRDGLTRVNEIARKTKVGTTTLYSWVNNYMDEGVHYSVTNMGDKVLKEKGVQLIDKILEYKRENGSKTSVAKIMRQIEAI